MKIILPLNKATSDDNRINGNVISDFKKGCQIFIWKEEKDWLVDEEQNVYQIWIEYSEKKERTLMFTSDLDDLEMFANSLTKSIEMFRRDYAHSIKERIENDLPL
jgi:hypothetical protein